MRPLVPRPFALVRIYLFRKARVTLLSHPHSSRRYLGADAHRDLERQLSERPPPEGFVVARAVLPPLSVGEVTLRLYGALSYSQISAHDLRRALYGA